MSRWIQSYNDYAACNPFPGWHVTLDFIIQLRVHSPTADMELRTLLRNKSAIEASTDIIINNNIWCMYWHNYWCNYYNSYRHLSLNIYDSHWILHVLQTKNERIGYLGREEIYYEEQEEEQEQDQEEQEEEEQEEQEQEEEQEENDIDFDNYEEYDEYKKEEEESKNPQSSEPRVINSLLGLGSFTIPTEYSDAPFNHVFNQTY